MFKKLKSYRFLLVLLFSIILGSLLGIIFKEKVTFLKPLGDIFLNLMFTLVVPLIFFTITSSIANMSSLKRLSKIIKYVFLVFVTTSAIAGIVMMITLKIFNPATSITLESSTVETISIGEQIVKALTVNDFYGLLSKNNVLPLIIFSILFGISLSLIGDKGKNITKTLSYLSEVMMKMIKLIMYYAPIGLCAYFAALVGEFGPTLVGSYAKSMAIYYILTILYFIVFYSIYSYIAGGKKGLKLFWKNVFSPTITSLATQSSLASLPVNLNAAKDMKIPKDIREVALPLGSTMHMEGSSMGAILKIVFLFGLFNKPFIGLDTYLLAILIAVLSAVVMAGVPGGGLIGETLIISLYGFPVEAFAIIATIGILIDPPATTLNVVGDTTSAMLVTKLVDKKYPEIEGSV